MAHTNVGQNNGSGDEKALFITNIATDAIKAFDETIVTKEFIRERHIDYGKSATFQVYGTAKAKYLPRGQKVDGSNNMLHSAITINIDDTLIADVKILEIDEAMSHYEVREEYSKQLGAALANEFDKNALQLACLAGRQAGPQDDIPGGSQLQVANADTDGQALAEALFMARQTLSEKDVPINIDRQAFFCRPAIYSLLSKTTDIINKDWGGAGVYADGKVFRVAGFDIIETNHVPNTNIEQKTGTNNTYHGDFTNTVGVCMSHGAIGAVYLKDLVTEIADQDYKVENQAVLLLAKYVMGMGILEARRAVEIQKTA